MSVPRLEQWPLIVRFWGLVWTAISCAQLFPFDARSLRFGGPHMFIGLVLLAGRVSRWVDLERREVVLGFGLFVPFIPWRTPLEDHGHVTLEHVLRRSRNTSHDGYEVSLGGKSVFRDKSLAAARSAAEHIAKRLGWGLLDHASGWGYREPGTLDEPLRQRLWRMQQLAPPGQLPPGSQLDVQVISAEELHITLPRASVLDQLLGPVTLGLLVALGAAVPLFLYVGRFVHPSVRSDGIFFGIATGLAAVGAALGVFTITAALERVERHVRLEVSPAGLRAEIRGLVGTKSVSMPGDAIETVGLGRPARLRPVAVTWAVNRVLVISDREVLSFGVGCTPGEQHWLRNAITYGLVADLFAQRVKAGAPAPRAPR